MIPGDRPVLGLYSITLVLHRNVTIRVFSLRKNYVNLTFVPDSHATYIWARYKFHIRLLD